MHTAFETIDFYAITIFGGQAKLLFIVKVEAILRRADDKLRLLVADVEVAWEELLHTLASP